MGTGRVTLSSVAREDLGVSYIVAARDILVSWTLVVVVLIEGIFIACKFRIPPVSLGNSTRSSNFNIRRDWVYA